MRVIFSILLLSSICQARDVILYLTDDKASKQIYRALDSTDIYTQWTLTRLRRDCNFRIIYGAEGPAIRIGSEPPQRLPRELYPDQILWMCLLEYVWEELTYEERCNYVDKMTEKFWDARWDGFEGDTNLYKFHGLFSRFEYPPPPVPPVNWSLE